MPFDFELFKSYFAELPDNKNLTLIRLGKKPRKKKGYIEVGIKKK